MPRYEYKVIPAPKKGVKAPGIKTTEARFAHAMSQVMNDLGAEGWEFQRSDTLPGEVRSGMGRKSTVYQSVLVFRRALMDVDSTADTDRRVDPPLSAPRSQVTENRKPDDQPEKAADSATPLRLSQKASDKEGG